MNNRARTKYKKNQFAVGLLHETFVEIVGRHSNAEYNAECCHSKHSCRQL